MDFGSYNRSAYGISSTRIVVSVTFLAVGVNPFPKYDSHYHDCHDNFNIFVKTILTKKLWFVKPEISLSVLDRLVPKPQEMAVWYALCVEQKK